MKKLFALIMLVFALNVQAQDYATDTTVVIAQVKQNVGWATTNDNVIDSIIVGYIKEGAFIVSSAIRSRILFDTVVTTAHDHFIAYDTLMVTIDDVGFFSRDSIKELRWRDREGWDTLEAVDDYLIGKFKWDERLPSYYDWDAGYLFLFPTPGHSGDSLLIIGYGRPDNMEGKVDLTDIVLTHRPAVVYYATAMFATRLGLPEAKEWDAKFNYWIQTINATINRKEFNVKQD